MRLAFRRSEAGRFKRLKERWRRPGGIHNKMRESKKGIKPKIGWKKPEVEEIPIINNLSELNGLKIKEIIISSKTGMKKRLELEKFCVEKKIKILNIKKLVKKKKIVKKKVEKKTVSEKIPETKKTPVKTEPIKKNVDKKEVTEVKKKEETKQVVKESKKDLKPSNTATDVSTAEAKK
ncbi:MAG: hypothetical protein KAT28_00400 [Candidatus Aenigmarchaeota archaeon]|nr:hypothetical protein [Candidatus Aenigmarchaeota archaeon]